MTETLTGEGIEVVDAPVLEESSDASPVELPEAFRPEGITLEGIVQNIRAELRHEMDAAVADAERRLAQAREMERAAFTGVPRETVHTEDLNIGIPMADGYTLTANSPSNGSIAWSSLHIVLLGVDYTITDANTNLKYAWFVKPGSYTPGTQIPLLVGNSLPTLGPQDALVFINNVSGGVSTPVSVLESSVVYAVGPGVIGAAQLDTATTTLLNNLTQADITLQNQLDGAITSYFQANAPWPDGSPSPSGGNVNQGDVWYDSDNGWTYRWTGSSGTPANTWFRIPDTDVSLLQSKLNTKITTYVANLATPPTAPSGGFTLGDFWMVTDQGNLLKRWDGAAWVNLLIGDGAIASGISGAKIGSGINGTNITTGTVSGTLVGTGISATNVSTGTLAGARVGTGVAPSVLTGSGTAPVAAIPTLTPAKLNTAFHMLY